MCCPLVIILRFNQLLYHAIYTCSFLVEPLRFSLSSQHSSCFRYSSSFILTKFLSLQTLSFSPFSLMFFILHEHKPIFFIVFHISLPNFFTILYFAAKSTQKPSSSSTFECTLSPKTVIFHDLHTSSNNLHRFFFNILLHFFTNSIPITMKSKHFLIVQTHIFCCIIPTQISLFYIIFNPKIFVC